MLGGQVGCDVLIGHPAQTGQPDDQQRDAHHREQPTTFAVGCLGVSSGYADGTAHPRHCAADRSVAEELRGNFTSCSRIARSQPYQPANGLGVNVYLVDRYSWIPSKPPSRPIPDCFTPPNGAAALEITPMLRPSIPVCSDSMSR